ncbi:metallophosphoesterase [Qipengyuania sp.]|uniref:metallophosphoesterase n=1 Tax=Qipengyuania sp. TaxID=2004515 RepID=UPI0035C84C14
MASVPVGQRWYVIGDVHGCCDLLKALADAIERDDAKRAEADTTVVLLGDLIDRGPDSAGAVQFAREWGQTRKVRHLAGNHEEMFLESFSQVDVLRHFLRHGGKETIHSYGIKGDQYNAMTMPELQTAMQQAVPASDRDFLAGAEVLIEAGDYLFVHAGIDPDRPHTDQKRSDLLWIRERFLRHPHAFSHVVVHGHTIVDEVEDTGTRIGIDTGAYRTGRLTALILEGSGRRTIQAVESNGSITIVTNGD